MRTKTNISSIILTMLLCITSSTIAQNTADTINRQFNDDLLDHLVGKWDATVTVHGFASTAVIEAEWVLNHQYLYVNTKSLEVIPWLNIPFEAAFFFGYNPSEKRYTVHEMSIHGDDGPYEGFCYAYRAGNEFKMVKKWSGSDTLTIQRFTWEPLSSSWHNAMRLLVDGKEEVLLDMKLIPAKQ